MSNKAMSVLDEDGHKWWCNKTIFSILYFDIVGLILSG